MARRQEQDQLTHRAGRGGHEQTATLEHATIRRKAVNTGENQCEAAQLFIREAPLKAH